MDMNKLLKIYENANLRATKVIMDYYADLVKDELDTREMANDLREDYEYAIENEDYDESFHEYMADFGDVNWAVDVDIDTEDTSNILLVLSILAEICTDLELEHLEQDTKAEFINQLQGENLALAEKYQKAMIESFNVYVGEGFETTQKSIKAYDDLIEVLDNEI